MSGSRKSVISFADAVRERTRVLDFLLIAAVPILLLAVFALPRSLKMELVLFYTDPTIVTAYTSQFVHLTVGHLLVNLVFYLLIVPTIYLYWTFAGRKKTFLVLFVVIILSFPFLLSWVNLALVRDRFGFGFSGMNAAFLGSLPLALTEYLREQFDMNLDLSFAPFYFFVGAAIIAAISVPMSRVSLYAALMSVFGAMSYGTWLIRSIDSAAALPRVIRARGFGELVAIGHLLFVLFPFVAFPVAPGEGTSLSNYFIHLLGYAMGFIAPFVTLTVVDID